MPTNSPEVYPLNFREKIGFSNVLEDLLKHCSSALGKSVLEVIEAHSDYSTLQRLFTEVREMQGILLSEQPLPSLHLIDCREALISIKPEGRYLQEEELSSLLAMLSTLHSLAKFFLIETATGEVDDESLSYLYPTLSSLYQDAPLFPKIEQNLNQLLDLEGKIKDTASPELFRIRQSLKETERSLSGMLSRIMKHARTEGWIEQDTQASIRDGRLVIPVSPQHKRKIKGIVHDESATGKTVFIEPVELVEANNRIRELESEERREIVRILTDIAKRLRPNINHLLKAYDLIAYTDAVRAKARWAQEYSAICPQLSNKPLINWVAAKHPMLMKTLSHLGRKIVPLDIALTEDSGRILIISGPNAGGKSVCLKTVGLLQYMLQCGLPVPLSEQSQVGIFNSFFLDIGDEQSIEDDLSTYSSHLKNMKHFERNASPSTLVLIDEFGGGTEPTIGGAIAEALLESLNNKGTYGVITTHYQNLKNYAEEHHGLVNGAMLYDRHEMRPLFTLSIGRAGSSFAIEIARKIGLPETLIDRATQIVGEDYVNIDKYLQDIIRDKRYWEGKRQNIRKEEKSLQEAIERYNTQTDEGIRLRKEIIAQAKQEAKKIVQEANGLIERTIKEIREVAAEREQTLSIRQNLKNYTSELSQEESLEHTEAQERAKRELDKLLRRRERRAERANKPSQVVHLTPNSHTQRSSSTNPLPLEEYHWSVGDTVKLLGQQSIATIIALNKSEATIAIGVIKMTVPLDRLRPVSQAQLQKSRSLQSKNSSSGGKSIIDQIHDKRLTFKQDIDLRGMRVSEGLDTVRHFIDDALQLGIQQVRILHGTGTGALKQAIRTYLSEIPEIRSFADEHVQLGGAGITVVNFR